MAVTELFANAAPPSTPLATTLGAAISSPLSSSGAVTVTSGGFPAAVTGKSQFRVIIDSEIFIVTNVSGNNWTAIGGQEGTTATTHLNGSQVFYSITAGAIANLLQKVDLSVFAIPAPTGTASTDTANWDAAIDAAEANGFGTIVPQGGNYSINAALHTIDKPGINIWCPVGSAACMLSPTSAVSTQVLRWTTSSFTVQQAGRFSGFTIDGTTAAAGCAGLHMGDIVGPELDDVVIQNFTGTASIGIWQENTADWTERVSMRRVHLNNNSIGMRYSVSGSGQTSFGYHRYHDLRINVTGGQVGIQTENGSLLYGIDIVAVVNASGTAPTLFKAKDTSQVVGRAYIGAETSGTGAIRFDVATGASVRLGGWVGFPGATDSVAGSGILAIGVQRVSATFATNQSVTSATAWQVFTGYVLPAVPAAVGDIVTATFAGLISNGGPDLLLDFGTLNGSGAIVNQFGKGGSVTNTDLGSMYVVGSVYAGFSFTASKTLTASDLVNGTVTICPIGLLHAAGSGQIIGANQQARVEIVVVPGDIAVV